MVRTKLGKLAALARMFVARSYNIGVGLLVVGESKKTWPSLTTAVDTMKIPKSHLMVEKWREISLRFKPALQVEIYNTTNG